MQGERDAVFEIGQRTPTSCAMRQGETERRARALLDGRADPVEWVLTRQATRIAHPANTPGRTRRLVSKPTSVSPDRESTSGHASQSRSFLVGQIDVRRPWHGHFTDENSWPTSCQATWTPPNAGEICIGNLYDRLWRGAHCVGLTTQMLSLTSRLLGVSPWALLLVTCAQKATSSIFLASTSLCSPHQLNRTDARCSTR